MTHEKLSPEKAYTSHASFQDNGQKTPAEGDMVNFDAEEGPKGLKAVNVLKL